MLVANVFLCRNEKTPPAVTCLQRHVRQKSIIEDRPQKLRGKKQKLFVETRLAFRANWRKEA